MIHVVSPGKLILSGEHAVVYGAPACALAVNHTIQGEYRQQAQDDTITLRNRALKIEASMTRAEIFALRNILLKRYQDFTHNKLMIDQVMTQPIEICWFAISQILFLVDISSVATLGKGGIDITLTTTLPIGCGMGSSAALIVNLILGSSHLFGLSLSQQQIYELALTTENLQHGYSSGLDIKLSLNGGMHRFQNHQLQALSIAPPLPLQYVNSGKPQSSTGECVAFVKRQSCSPIVWQSFAKTTRDFMLALQEKNQQQLITTIKKNHRLLCDLGVVPLHTQALIARIEQQGGAAKICGAGSIRGDHAGIILVIHPFALQELCQSYQLAPPNFLTSTVRGAFVAQV